MSDQVEVVEMPGRSLEFCNADCGCAGGQLAENCLFDPNCSICSHYMNTFTEEDAVGILRELGFTVIQVDEEGFHA